MYSKCIYLKLEMPEPLAISQVIACHARESCSAYACSLPAVNSPSPRQLLLQGWRDGEVGTQAALHLLGTFLERYGEQGGSHGP